MSVLKDYAMKESKLAEVMKSLGLKCNKCKSDPGKTGKTFRDKVLRG